MNSPQWKDIFYSFSVFKIEIISLFFSRLSQSLLSITSSKDYDLQYKELNRLLKRILVFFKYVNLKGILSVGIYFLPVN
jgi:hypothetical protein